MPAWEMHVSLVCCYFRLPAHHIPFHTTCNTPHPTHPTPHILYHPPPHHTTCPQPHTTHSTSHTTPSPHHTTHPAFPPPSPPLAHPHVTLPHPHTQMRASHPPACTITLWMSNKVEPRVSSHWNSAPTQHKRATRKQGSLMGPLIIPCRDTYPRLMWCFCTDFCRCVMWG